MTAAEFLQIVNTRALLGWVPLVVVPLWCCTVPMARSLVLGLCLCYLVALGLHRGEGEGGFDTLDNVARLFEQPWVLVGDWVH